MIVKVPCSAVRLVPVLVMLLFLSVVSRWWGWCRGLSCRRFSGEVGLEDLAQPVEPALPGGALAGEPVRGQLEADRLEPAGAGAAHLLGADQPARLEDSQVLDHGREGHVQRPGQLAHRGRAGAEAFDQVAAGGIAQGPEDLVDRLILKH